MHPRYLDRQALVACWREALLAQAVLLGRTRGYTSHPQLDRFRALADPAGGVGAFLGPLAEEADARGYSFDRTRIVGGAAPASPLPVTAGQLDLEWAHLLAKLAARSPDVAARWAGVVGPQPHPLFVVVPGPVAAWERAVR